MVLSVVCLQEARMQWRVTGGLWHWYASLSRDVNGKTQVDNNVWSWNVKLAVLEVNHVDHEGVCPKEPSLEIPGGADLSPQFVLSTGMQHVGCFLAMAFCMRSCGAKDA